MPTVVFAGRKGGCGKTTGATNFAAWLACQGFKVVLLDTDPERNSQVFITMRSANEVTPAIPFEFAHGDPRRTIISLAGEYDWVVVDTPGLDSTETRRAVAVAHVAVFPFKTSLYDMKTLPVMDQLAQDVQVTRPDMVAVCYCSETAPGKSGEKQRLGAHDALAKCEAIKVLDAFTVKRNAYTESVKYGRSVGEFDDKTAAAEFDRLAREIVSHVQ